MLENTNKAIAYNTIILYGKTIINTACALLTTRFALQALGVVDYGLYVVLGGIISFVSIFNTIMLSTSNRFIAVAIGKGSLEEVNQQFNVNFIVHIAIALFALVIAFPVGKWYIPRFVNYDGPLQNAMMVYVISIIGCILSFVGVPYNGLLMAKEKFGVFSLAEVVIHIIKLLFSLLLVYFFEQKLLIYTVAMAVLTALPTVIYIMYCKSFFREMVHFRLVRDVRMYKRVFSFSAWVSIGAIAQVGKNQGAALVVNAFFNTVMNTAMGVASSVNSYVQLFAQNVTQPMAPQITKSYASGDYKRADDLLVMSAKYSFMFTMLIASFLLVAPAWVLHIWLGEVPEYSAIFLVLFVIDSILRSVNSGVANIIFADGRIGLFQALTSILNLLSIVAAYFVLKGGAEAYYLVITYIIFSIILFFVIQYSLHRTLHYDSSSLWKKAYLPSFLTLALFSLVLLLPTIIHPIFNILISLVYLCIIEWFVCLSRDERERFLLFVKQKTNNIRWRKN